MAFTLIPVEAMGPKGVIHLPPSGFNESMITKPWRSCSSLREGSTLLAKVDESWLWFLDHLENYYDLLSPVSNSKLCIYYFCKGRPVVRGQPVSQGALIIVALVLAETVRRFDLASIAGSNTSGIIHLTARVLERIQYYNPLD